MVYIKIQRSDKNEVGEFERTLVYMKFSVLNTRWLTRDDGNDDGENEERETTMVCTENVGLYRERRWFGNDLLRERR